MSGELRRFPKSPVNACGHCRTFAIDSVVGLVGGEMAGSDESLGLSLHIRHFRLGSMRNLSLPSGPIP